MGIKDLNTMMPVKNWNHYGEGTLFSTVIKNKSGNFGCYHGTISKKLKHFTAF